MLAVIGVVIGIGLHPFPPRLEQQIFGAADVGREDQYVEVADLASSGARHVRGGIGRAFQQHELNPRGGERAPRHLGLPQGLRLRDFRGGALIGKERGDRRRQAGIGEPVRERREHRLAARDADHAVPVARAESGGVAAAGEQVDEGSYRAHRAASAQSCSTSAIPAALSG
jgi:hypothetical protein